MGCIIETAIDLLFEGFFEFLVYCYVKAVGLILPEKKASEKTKKWIRRFAAFFSGTAMFTLFIGLICLIQTDPIVRSAGSYMTFGALGIMGLQILLGIITKIIGKFRK